MDSSFSSRLKKVQELAESILQEDFETLDVSTLSLLKLIEDLPPLTNLQNVDKFGQSQVEQCAVALWNFAVAKKNGGNLTPKLNARVRHAAAHLVFLSNSGTSDDALLKKQIMMAQKTARAWLDAGEPTMAEGPLDVATQCIEKCRSRLIADMERNNDNNTLELLKKKRIEINKDMLKISCYKSEMAFNMNDQDTALRNALAAKELLSCSPQEAGYLSMLCYNCGVECFQRRAYSHCVNWLRESFEIGKGDNAVGAKSQARTLRLLANAYMEWDGVEHCQKALNAIGLANTEHSHPAGLFLKVKILLQGQTGEERLRAGVSDVMRHAELTLDLGLNTIRLLFQHKKSDLAFEGLQQLSQRFMNTPDHHHVALVHIEMLLQNNQLQQAKELVEQVITDHCKGSPLDEAIRNQLHVLLWDQAAKHFDKEQHGEALQWYNYSLSLFSVDEKKSKNCAKLHRNRASCMLGLLQWEKAEDVILEAEKCDDNSPHTYFLKFKIALMQNKEEQAIESLQRITGYGSGHPGSKFREGQADLMEVDGDTDSGTIHGLISLAAQLAFEQNNNMLSILALERLSEVSPDPLQVLTALRCLSRLRLTLMTQEPANSSDMRGIIMSYINKAIQKLSMLCNDGKLKDSQHQNESMWFMKIAWNIALQCEDMPSDMQQLFLLCVKLMEMCTQDLSSLVRQKTCLLMASAAVLQAARQIHDLDRPTAYRQAIEHVQECGKVSRRIEEYRGSTGDCISPDTITPLLLILYEFEARAKLGDSGVEDVLEKALSLPQCDAKAFETIAALAMDPPLQNRNLAMRALQIAIKKYLKSDDIDFPKCSKAFHSLIELSLQNSCLSDIPSKEDTWLYFNNVMDIIENQAKDAYPEMEILWLMTKAWNCGIHLYSSNLYGEAVRWCELAMRLLKRLGSLGDNYRSQMTKVYGEILAKMNPSSEMSGVRGLLV